MTQPLEPPPVTSPENWTCSPMGLTGMDGTGKQEVIPRGGDPVTLQLPLKTGHSTDMPVRWDGPSVTECTLGTLADWPEAPVHGKEAWDRPLCPWCTSRNTSPLCSGQCPGNSKRLESPGISEPRQEGAGLAGAPLPHTQLFPWCSTVSQAPNALRSPI